MGGLHCRREGAEDHGRTPLPEGGGRGSWADSTARGRGQCAKITDIPVIDHRLMNRVTSFPDYGYEGRNRIRPFSKSRSLGARSTVFSYLESAA